jgi:class 3 adenylate cyclase
MLRQSKICIGCWQQFHLPVPLRGVLSAPFRAVGIRPSRMNPNTCTICEKMFKTVMRSRNVTVDVTVLFADLRGFTGLSQSLPAEAVSSMLDVFYDECAGAIWEYDGLLAKTMGDAIMAIFNFPIHRDDHAVQAVLAAREILRRCEDRRAELAQELSLVGGELGVGVGVDSGPVSFGEFGRSHRDVTAIGTVVNTAARAQAAAGAGEILVTQTVYDRARAQMAESQARPFSLKGFDHLIELYAA